VTIIFNIFVCYITICKVIVDCLLQEHLVCYGSENGSLHCYDIINKENIWEIKIGDTRVKCLIKVDNRLVTALSDGHVTVWELNGSKKPVESCSLFLDCRITCICNNSLR